MKQKLKLRIDKWNTQDGLYLWINDKLYHFTCFSPTEIMELEDSLYKKLNKGIIIKKLEYKFGEGKRIILEVRRLVNKLGKKMNNINQKPVQLNLI
jgi:hypothetical protein